GSPLCAAKGKKVPRERGSSRGCGPGPALGRSLSVQSADLDDPAARVGHLAPLDAGQLVVQALGHGSDLVVGDDVVLVLVAEQADGGDNGGGAAAPGLLEPAALGGVDELVDGDLALLDVVAPVLEHLDAALARDAGQDGAA